MHKKTISWKPKNSYWNCKSPWKKISSRNVLYSFALQNFFENLDMDIILTSKKQVSFVASKRRCSKLKSVLSGAIMIWFLLLSLFLIISKIFSLQISLHLPAKICISTCFLLHQILILINKKHGYNKLNLINCLVF